MVLLNPTTARASTTISWPSERSCLITVPLPLMHAMPVPVSFCMKIVFWLDRNRRKPIWPRMNVDAAPISTSPFEHRYESRAHRNSPPICARSSTMILSPSRRPARAMYPSRLSLAMFLKLFRKNGSPASRRWRPAYRPPCSDVMERTFGDMYAIEPGSALSSSPALSPIWTSCASVPITCTSSGSFRLAFAETFRRSAARAVWSMSAPIIAVSTDLDSSFFLSYTSWRERRSAVSTRTASATSPTAPTATATNMPHPTPSAMMPHIAPRCGALPMRKHHAESATHSRIHQTPAAPPRMKKLDASPSGSSKYHLS
mmetsp:Transcript_1839/g.7633  ORF Transcript_1839/g.7633 Transcript_1839/m.7633 type:complete len:315 (+) Transcript_1839:304-1248(+)